jgi:hypothetical protein
MDFSWGDLLNTVGTGFDIYSGIESMNMASDLYNVAAGSAEQQDAIAKAQWGISQPVMQKQGQVAISDADSYLATAPQRRQILDKQLGLQAKDLDIYGQYMPGLQTAYYKNMQGDLDAYGDNQGVRDDILTEQYKNQLAGQGLNAGVIAAQSANLDTYNQNRDIIQDYYDQSRDGLNIDEQVRMARSDVSQAFDDQNAASRRSMARMGVNPNSGRFVDQARLDATEKAKAMAGAATSARNSAKNVNYARLGGATNVLKGQAPAGYGNTTQAPQNTGMGMYTAPAQSGTSLSGVSGGGTALSGLGSSANTTANLAGVAANAAGTSFGSAGKGLAAWQKNAGDDSFINSNIW